MRFSVSNVHKESLFPRHPLMCHLPASSTSPWSLLSSGNLPNTGGGEEERPADQPPTPHLPFLFSSFFSLLKGEISWSPFYLTHHSPNIKRLAEAEGTGVDKMGERYKLPVIKNNKSWGYKVQHSDYS